MRAVVVVFVCSAMFLGAAVVDAVAASCHRSPATHRWDVGKRSSCRDNQ
jgi:hypothetical protein